MRSRFGDGISMGFLWCFFIGTARGPSPTECRSGMRFSRDSERISIALINHSLDPIESRPGGRSYRAICKLTIRGRDSEMGSLWKFYRVRYQGSLSELYRISIAVTNHSLDPSLFSRLNLPYKTLRQGISA